MTSFLTKAFILIVCSSAAQAQFSETVADLSFKISPLKEEDLYFKFAAGDKIIFKLIEENGKELNEVEVVEYPDVKRFSIRKTSSVLHQEIQVKSKAVYVFRFKNTALNKRDCKIQISRIPASPETYGFNTTVAWTTLSDTTWKTSWKDGIIRYDTSHISKTKRGIIKEENVEEIILNKNQRLHAKANIKSAKSSLSFILPKDQLSSDREKKLTSWAYWVGVDEAGNKAWEQNSKIVTKIVKGGASMLMTPLGALAVGVVADLSVPTMGEDVEYWIADNQNTAIFNTEGKGFKYIDHGKGIAGYQKFNGGTTRAYNVLLKNDNLIQGIDVNVKVIAIYTVKEWGDVKYIDTKITPIKGRIRERVPYIQQVKKPVLTD